MDFSTLNLNYFDVIIASIILILGLKGFINGVIKEFFGLLGLIGGVYIASRMADQAAIFIDANFFQMENMAALKLIGFLAILASLWLISIAIGGLFSKLTYASGLGFMNRLLGFVVGGGKYFLIFALIITALSNVTLVKDNLEKYVKDSILYPYLRESGAFLINIDLTTFNADFNSTLAQPTVISQETNQTDVK